MSRPTRVIIDPSALLHNTARIRHLAPGKKLIAMVKANAYGCGLSQVVPVLEGHVDAFGVACLEEALKIRALGVRTPCVLFQGFFNLEELEVVAQQQFSCVIHQQRQAEWLLKNPLSRPISIWIKVNTGMNRLGFNPAELPALMDAINNCAWINKDIGLMTHLACADQPERSENKEQIALFQQIVLPGIKQRSIANSAAIIALPETHEEVVRAGIMLYGVSPFPHQSAAHLGLKPVMSLVSAVSALNYIPPAAKVGYGSTWSSDMPSIIGIVPVGYADGYPRHIAKKTPVWVKGQEVPIVGRVSMDMLAIDLTQHPEVTIGEPVELWGTHIAVERIAESAGTLGYELLCQITERPRFR
jgi:alanine racemase